MKITFHTFRIGDVEDPDIWAADPIMRWQETEQGQWVMQHAHNVTYYQSPDMTSFGYRYVIRGEIYDARKITEYFLRWPDQSPPSSG